MKRLLLVAAAFAALPLLAQNNFPLYLAGDFNGWAANGTVMTAMGGGIWSASISGLTPNAQYAFQVTDGNWGSWYTPGGHTWLYADSSGNATVSIDLNTYNDGWTYPTDRISTSGNPTTWTAVGAWNGWNNADPTAVMTSIGGGIYELEKTIPNAGFWGFKATRSGAWDAQIGADGKNWNAAESTFTTTSSNETVDMFVNTLNGTLLVTIVPEPSAVALLGLGGLLAIQRLLRRRK